MPPKQASMSIEMIACRMNKPLIKFLYSISIKYSKSSVRLCQENFFIWRLFFSFYAVKKKYGVKTTDPQKKIRKTLYRIKKYLESRHFFPVNSLFQPHKHPIAKMSLLNLLFLTGNTSALTGLCATSLWSPRWNIPALDRMSVIPTTIHIIYPLYTLTIDPDDLRYHCGE